MNTKDRYAILKVASFYKSEYLRLRNPNDPWINHQAKQAFYDALNALKYYKLIEDFDFDRGILIQGKWY